MSSLTVTLIVAGTIFLLWVLLNMRKNRPDGTFIRNVPSYRTMMGYIMPTRNEAVVYFDSYIDAEPLLEYLEQAKPKLGCDVTHCLVAACSIAILDNPKMNQFVSGHRLYQRKNGYISFSAKRRRGDSRAKLTAIKYKIDPEQTFADFCKWVDGKLNVKVYEKKTAEDKELGIYTKLPRPLLKRAVGVVRWLDYHNILPNAFIEGDAFYTSIFVANLGSVGMAPGFHHLYEWGNAPLFMMAGKIEDKPVIVDGQVTSRKTLHVRWSYDERIDDGLTANYGINSVKRALEQPNLYFGCLAEDGSDATKFGELPSAHEDDRHRQARDA
jgi:hypothetical protein